MNVNPVTGLYFLRAEIQAQDDELRVLLTRLKNTFHSQSRSPIIAVYTLAL